MISLQMPKSAQGIIRKQKKLDSGQINANNIAVLEQNSRPNLTKYDFQQFLYEQEEKKENLSSKI